MGALGIIIAAVVLVIALLMAYWTILLSMYPESLRTNEIYTVVTNDLWRLRVCRYRRGRTEGEPVLLVHGFMANHHNFTEPEGGSLAGYLAKKGYDCWCVDLRGSRSSLPPFEHNINEPVFDDFVYRDLPAVIMHIRKITGYARVHYVGHSMGGMLLYAYVQAHGDAHFASATTLGAPIGFDGTNIKIPDIVVRLARLVPAFVGSLQRGFAPIGFILGLGQSIFPINLKNVHPELRAEHLFNMLENPPPSVLAEMAFWTKTKTFRMNEDKLDVLEGMKTMTTPLLAIFAGRDPFVAPDKGEKFINSLPHNDKAVLVLSKERGATEDYGHCDLAFGKEGEREVFEPIVKWLETHAITERIKLYDGGDGAIRAPLKEEERADILSGTSYAHLRPEPEEPPAATEASAPPEVSAVPAPKRKAATAKTKTKAKAAPKKAAAKKAAPKKPAAKKKASAAVPSKAKAKPAPAKKKTAAKPKAKPKTRP